MRRMMEFQLDLAITPENVEAMKVSKATGEPLVIKMTLPIDAVIRRINARIFPKEQTILHPQTKEIVRAMVPEELVYLWCEADDESPTEVQDLYVIPTGFKVPAAADYLGTFLLQSGLQAFHVYRPHGEKSGQFIPIH